MDLTKMQFLRNRKNVNQFIGRNPIIDLIEYLNSSFFLYSMKDVFLEMKISAVLLVIYFNWKQIGKYILGCKYQKLNYSNDVIYKLQN